MRKGVVQFDRVFQGLQDLMEGNFDAVPVGSRRLIDCDAQPYLPNDWKIESHVKSGQLEFDPEKIVLHLEPGQKAGTIKGDKLRMALQDKPTLNACVLDHLLANTSLIPDSWKLDDQGNTRYIYFWGTVYRASRGRLYVRSLYFSGGRWRWDYNWLGREFGAQNPAAVLAS